MFSPELKKGSMEMLILSLVEARARHGYEIGKLIESRSGGKLKFALPSLYPALLRLENRGWIKGRWVEKPGERQSCFYKLTAEGRRVLTQKTGDLGRVHRGREQHHGDERCVTGKPLSATTLAAGVEAGAGAEDRPRAGGPARGLLPRRHFRRHERGRGRTTRGAADRELGRPRP